MNSKSYIVYRKYTWEMQNLFLLNLNRSSGSVGKLEKGRAGNIQLSLQSLFTYPPPARKRKIQFQLTAYNPFI